MPSGEVAPMVGVGLTIPLTCALAALQMTSAGRIAVINATLSRILRFAMNSSGARFSDIGQSLSRGSFERSAAADVQIVIQRLVPLRLPCIEPRKSSLLSAVRCRMRTEIFGPRLNLNDGRRGCRRWSCFEWAGLGSDAACNQHAREDRCSEKDTHGATRLRLCLFAGEWAARSACSIKYAFIVLTPMKSHFDATCVTQLRALLVFNNTFN
jgi:hypothetical protein